MEPKLGSRMVYHPRLAQCFEDTLLELDSQDRSPDHASIGLPVRKAL